MLPVLKGVGATRPIHLRHTESAIEKVRHHQRTQVHPIGRLWVSPYDNGPSWVEDRHMLGPYRKIALRATQAARSEINWTAGLLCRRSFQVRDRDLGGAADVDGH